MNLRNNRTLAPEPGADFIHPSELNVPRQRKMKSRSTILAARPTPKGIGKKKIKNTVLRGNWTEEDMEAALESITSGIFSIRKASRHYAIPQTTVRNHLYGTTQHKFGSIPKALTCEEEETLVQWCLQLCDEGRPVTLGVLRQRVAQMTINRITTFKDGLPGPKWWQGFKKRHPEVSLRSAQCVEVARVKAMSSCNLHNFYSTLQSIYSTVSLDPSRIWNCDETGVQAGNRTGLRVIARKGMRNVAESVPGNREWLTVLCCVNAQGGKLPNLYVFKGKRMRDTDLLQGCEPGAIMSYQKKAWITDVLFTAWLDHFKKTVPGGISADRPHLLVCDGHGSHVTTETVQKAKAMGLHILQLPPHTSHKLQPLDVACFSPFKSVFRNLRSNFMHRNRDKEMCKEDLASLVSQSLQQAMTPSNISAGFKKTGIWPFDATAVKPDPIADQMQADQMQAVESNVVESNVEGTAVDVHMAAASELAPESGLAALALAAELPPTHSVAAVDGIGTFNNDHVNGVAANNVALNSVAAVSEIAVNNMACNDPALVLI